jgi:HK97 family phage prohead protease
MNRKQASFRISDVKVAPPSDEQGQGIFEAIVAVFGNVDLVGDRIKAGAFAKSLQRWKDSGDPLPVLFSHEWNNLDAHCGEVVEAEELMPGDSRLPAAIKDNGGLYIKAQLDMDDAFGVKLFNKLRRRRIREMSFAYDVLDEKSSNGVNDLLELDLIEVGPTLKGANPATQLLATKSQKQALPGSYEERRNAISVAVDGWAAGQFGEDYRESVWAWVCATYEDRVIVDVEDMREGSAGVRFYEIPLSESDDGYELGDAVEVELVTSVEPKAFGFVRVKSGRVLSSKNETKLRDAVQMLEDASKVIGDVLASVQTDDGGKSDESTSVRAMTPAVVSLRASVEMAEIA